MNRRAPASITDLHAFRRHRLTNDWLIVVFVTALGACAAVLALELAHMVGSAVGAGL